MRVVDILNLEVKKIRTLIQEDTKETVLKNLAKTPRRLMVGDKKDHPVAVVGYGPSLKTTWEILPKYKSIITTSGAHNFLIGKGVIPTYHVECDPRLHKAKFTEKPHPSVEYLVGSSANEQIVNQLLGNDLKLWNFELRQCMDLPSYERELPTYGDVGQQAVYIAKVLGFREIHLFGFDYNFENSGEQHAGEHGREDKTQDYWWKCGNRLFKTNIEFVKNLKFFDLLISENDELDLQVYGNGLLSYYLEEKFKND